MLERSGLLAIWSDSVMTGEAVPSTKPDGQPDYSDAAIQYPLADEYAVRDGAVSDDGFAKGLQR